MVFTTTSFHEIQQRQAQGIEHTGFTHPDIPHRDAMRARTRGPVQMRLVDVRRSTYASLHGAYTRWKDSGPRHGRPARSSGLAGLV